MNYVELFAYSKGRYEGGVVNAVRQLQLLTTQTDYILLI